MKLTKTLLTTTLLAFSTAMISPVSYANDVKKQFQQGVAAHEQGDYHRAFKLFKPLAEQGLVNAQYNLGQMYRKGEGVKQNNTQAVKWYQNAAKKGFAQAQYNLGVMYKYGDGVKQNKQQAKYWVGKACDNGLQEGCYWLRRL